MSHLSHLCSMQTPPDRFVSTRIPRADRAMWDTASSQWAFMQVIDRTAHRSLTLAVQVTRVPVHRKANPQGERPTAHGRLDEVRVRVAWDNDRSGMGAKGAVNRGWPHVNYMQQQRGERAPHCCKLPNCWETGCSHTTRHWTPLLGAHESALAVCTTSCTSCTSSSPMSIANKASGRPRLRLHSPASPCPQTSFINQPPRYPLQVRQKSSL